jgi:hypothetical protein
MKLDRALGRTREFGERAKALRRNQQSQSGDIFVVNWH